jgi:hypothetical protein
MQTNYGEYEIKSLLSKVKIVNNEMYKSPRIVLYFENNLLLVALLF